VKVDFKDLTDEELKEKYLALYQSVRVIGCYSTRDLIELDLLEEELLRRGYRIFEEPVLVKEEAGKKQRRMR